MNMGRIMGKRSAAPVTEAQRRYIAGHMGDRPRTRLARDAGVSPRTLYRILGRLGAPMDYTLCQKRGGIEEELSRLYPVMSASEISAAVGVSASTVKRWARRLGLRHTAETEARLREKSTGMYVWSPEKRAEASRRRRALYRLEHLRAISGEKRRTRLPVRTLPLKTQSAVRRLVRLFGYTRTDDGCTLERPASPVGKVDEAYYAKRYRIIFTDRNENGHERNDWHHGDDSPGVGGREDADTL